MQSQSRRNNYEDVDIKAQSFFDLLIEQVLDRFVEERLEKVLEAQFSYVLRELRSANSQNFSELSTKLDENAKVSEILKTLGPRITKLSREVDLLKPLLVDVKKKTDNMADREKPSVSDSVISELKPLMEEANIIRSSSIADSLIGLMDRMCELEESTRTISPDHLRGLRIRIDRALSELEILPYSVKKGEIFDPELMEAVDTKQVYSSFENEKILEVKANGYKLQDRIVRRALVVVGKYSVKEFSNGFQK